MGAGLRANGRNPTLSRLILRPGRLVRRGVASVLMLQKMMAKVFGTKNDREIKKIQPIVVAVN